MSFQKTESDRDSLEPRRVLLLGDAAINYTGITGEICISWSATDFYSSVHTTRQISLFCLSICSCLHFRTIKFVPWESNVAERKKQAVKLSFKTDNHFNIISVQVQRFFFFVRLINAYWTFNDWRHVSTRALQRRLVAAMTRSESALHNVRS